MRLFSFLKRKSEDAVPPPPKPKAGARGKASVQAEPVDSVEQARTRARQRLIGAVVLVVAGVIGFPLVFETQPRPLSVNTPIDIVGRDGAVKPGTVAPAATPARAAASQSSSGRVITENVADAGREVPPPAVSVPATPEHAGPSSALDHAGKPEAPQVAALPSAVKPSASAAASRPSAAKPAPEKKPSEKPSEKPPEKPAAKPAEKPAVKPSDASRAQALLEGNDRAAAAKKPDAAAANTRFAVQVGAFSDTSAAREMRLKVEKIGLKTYTQVVETSLGTRIRVRVGPFASRAEADKAAAKLKSASLPAAVSPL